MNIYLTNEKVILKRYERTRAINVILPGANVPVAPYFSRI
jgi:hypothetical protein